MYNSVSGLATSPAPRCGGTARQMLCPMAAPLTAFAHCYSSSVFVVMFAKLTPAFILTFPIFAPVF
jgi:hypothetical protein